MKSLVSVVINTRDEAEQLARALRSVKEWADEIVVIDMESRDKSVEVARKFGAKVFRHRPEEYVELARNFGIMKAKGPWILVLDPDEEITPELGRKLKEVATKADKNGLSFVRIARKNVIFGKWIMNSRWWPNYMARFFKKGTVSWSGIIHEEQQTKGIGEDLNAEERLAIVHHHYDSIEKFVLWANRYGGVRAAMLGQRGYKFTWVDLVRKPMGEFLSRYFFGEGYKDGVHGIALALLQAYAELIVYLKVWEGEGFSPGDISLGEINAVLKGEQKELNYWLADSALKEDSNPVEQLRQRVVRKLSSR